MHVDPNGRIAVRTSVLIGAINVVILAALGYSVFTLNRLKKVAKKQTLRIIKKKKYRIEQRIVTYMSYTKIKWAYRVAVANLIVNMIIGAFNSSFGSIIVYVLKRYFKTYTKKVKNYGWWGKKVTVEYINFSRRR